MRFRRLGAAVVLAVVGTVGAPQASASDGPTLVDGITYLSAPGGIALMRSLAATVPADAGSADPVVAVKRMVVEDGAGYLVGDVVFTTREIVARAIVVDARGTTRLLAESRSQRKAEGDREVLYCTGPYMIENPAYTECMRAADEYGKVVGVICVGRPESCGTVTQTYAELRASCYELPMLIEVAGFCQLVRIPATGVQPVDEQVEETVDDAKTEYCRYRRPCDVS